jgi:hypothetical protein
MTPEVSFTVIGATTLSIMILDIMTFSVKTLSIRGLYVTLSINDTHLTMRCQCDDCHFGECRVLFTVIMLSVIMLSVVATNRNRFIVKAIGDMCSNLKNTLAYYTKVDLL